MTQLLDRKSPTVADLPEERGSGRTLDNRSIAQLELNAHIEQQAEAIAPETLLNLYGRIIARDSFLPNLEELNIVYARVGGKVTRSRHNPCLYQMEMPGKTICGTREAVWNWYIDRREMLELVAAARPLPF